jgi:hypothetical protein
MTTPIGRALNKKLNLGVEHALYHKPGKFYESLRKFPGALFDSDGYVVFETSQAYKSCPQLRHGKKVNVNGTGISSISGYVRDMRIRELITNDLTEKI